MAKIEVDLSPGNMVGYRYYQARSGAIRICTPSGSHSIELSKAQVEGLWLFPIDLEDFDAELYFEHYKAEAEGKKG